MTKPIRLAVMQFSHETVTFLPSETGIEAFTYPGSPCAGEALLQSDPRGYIGGFVQVAREFDGVEVVGLESPRWPKTGSGSGWVTEEAFEHFSARMLAGLRAQGPFDGVYLALHGAMAVRGIARPEAELARRVRAVVGPRVPIAGTFDPHGNEDEAFLDQADLAFAVKYFPHYDSHLQGQRAARMLVRTIRGSYRPVHAVIKVPIISATVVQWTGASPWSDLVQRALVWEARCPDAFVNVFFGFPWSDVPDGGMCIQVITNGDAGLAGRIARDMAGFAWRKREELLESTDIRPMAEAVAAAKVAVQQGQAPVVLADYSDRSGAAGWLLREIIAQDLGRTLVATIADAGAIEALRNQRPGTAVSLAVGGGEEASAGEPVRVEGRLRQILPRGEQTWALVEFGAGNVLVLSPWLVQVTDPAWVHELGLELSDFSVFAIKSRVHFRRGFDDSGFAPTILLVDPPEPFMGTTGLDALHYENLDLSQFYPYGEPKFPAA